MRILVTGANGFIGQALCRALIKAGHNIRCAARSGAPNRNIGNSYVQAGTSGLSVAQTGEALETVRIGDIGPDTDWAAALTGIEAVVHLAARVHVLKESARNPLAEFRLVNVAGTERLARMAVTAGVRRLVYVSSIKVNGEHTHEIPFTEADTPAPQDAYGLSKWEAEQALLKIAEQTGLEVVILRPPLVYGPGVGGNFLRMMNLVNRGLPLPLGTIRNSRSLVYLGNLVDALIACVGHPHAPGNIFLIGDGEDVSTPELIRRLAQAMGRRPHLVSFPPALLRLAGLLTGKSAEIERLLGSLRVDSSRIRRELEWTPTFSMVQGLRDTASWYFRTAK
ncbi:MAG: UDP-glucose 4-epimerase family protein [Bacteroidota bacterium]